MKRESVFENLDEKSLKRKFIAGDVIKRSTVNERQIRCIVSTAKPDRDGDVVIPAGCDLKNFLKNPLVLRDHDRKCPIATASVEIKATRVEALITFPPEGTSADSDEALRLVKSGVLSAVSPGFIIRESKPIRGGGVTISKWELCEISICSVPANPDAIITQRSIDEASEARRREIQVLRLKHPPEIAPVAVKTTRAAYVSDAELNRMGEEIAALRDAGRGNPARGPAAFAAQKAKEIERDALSRASSAYAAHGGGNASKQ